MPKPIADPAESLARKLHEEYRLAIVALNDETGKDVAAKSWRGINDMQRRGMVLFAQNLLKNPPQELFAAELARRIG